MLSSGKKEFRQSIVKIFSSDKTSQPRGSLFERGGSQDAGVPSKPTERIPPSIRIIPLSSEYGGTVDNSAHKVSFRAPDSGKFSLLSMKPKTKFCSRRTSHFKINTVCDVTDAWEAYSAYEIEKAAVKQVAPPSLPIYRLIDKLYKEVFLQVDNPMRFKLDAQGKVFPLKFKCKNTHVPHLMVTYGFDTVPSKENAAFHKTEVGKSSFLIEGPRHINFVGLMLEVTSGNLTTSVGCSFKSDRQSSSKPVNRSLADLGSNRNNKKTLAVDPSTRLPVINYKEFLEFSIDVPDKSEMDSRRMQSSSLHKMKNLTKMGSGWDSPSKTATMFTEPPTNMVSQSTPGTARTEIVSPGSPQLEEHTSEQPGSSRRKTYVYTALGQTIYPSEKESLDESGLIVRDPEHMGHVESNKVLAGKFLQFEQFSRENFLAIERFRQQRVLAIKLQKQEEKKSGKTSLSVRNQRLREEVDTFVT